MTRPWSRAFRLPPSQGLARATPGGWGEEGGGCPGLVLQDAAGTQWSCCLQAAVSEKCPQQGATWQPVSLEAFPCGPTSGITILCIGSVLGGRLLSIGSSPRLPLSSQRTDFSGPLVSVGCVPTANLPARERWFRSQVLLFCRLLLGCGLYCRAGCKEGTTSSCLQPHPPHLPEGSTCS